MGQVASKGLSRVLRAIWRVADAASETSRYCVALDEQTPHRKLATFEGDYWVCGVTGEMTRDQFPDEISSITDANWTRKSVIHPPTEKQLAVDKRWLGTFERYRSGGRLFEAGCGLGKKLRAAADMGWKVEGNDISEVAADHAHQLSGAKVHLGELSSLSLEADSYDVILFDNVYEHVRDPRASLAALVAALRPGGAMFLQTLNGNCWSLRRWPHDWFYFGDTHLHVPTMASLRRLVEEMGLRVGRTRTHGYSSTPRGRATTGTKWRRRMDKKVSLVAARLGLGHRVEMMLEKV